MDYGNTSDSENDMRNTAHCRPLVVELELSDKRNLLHEKEDQSWDEN